MARERSAKKTNDVRLRQAIAEKLKDTPEQQEVVSPLVMFLAKQGWSLGQMVFGKTEWHIPKSPSEQTKREKGRSFKGFPVDIAVFDSPNGCADPQHLLFIIECKQPTEEAGVSQLEAYFVGEPHVRLGIWANNADKGATGAFIYRKPDGGMLLKRRRIADIPRPGEAIRPEVQRTTFCDLIAPSPELFRSIVDDLLNKVVIEDNNITRREEQLDQLCNLLLLKLESDKQAKSNRKEPVVFRSRESEATTASEIKKRYTSFVDLYPDTFTTDQDKTLRFGENTIAACVEALAGLQLIDLGVSTVALAFQALRSEALKQREGQYFTPQAVIQAGVRLMGLQWEDIILDPACGTGGFLVESILEVSRQRPDMAEAELAKWAQTHIFGIEKDAIGLKLAKAIMQIAGDGSAHCVRGDSVRTHIWSKDFPHLNSATWQNGRFSVVITNPPFGQKLKVSGNDSRLSGLDIAMTDGGNYSDLEIGLIFLHRCWDWLKPGGRLGIVLPETYFFSPNYQFIYDWMKGKLEPEVVANIPMEAFQGFCRAKTNFYVFRKMSRGRRMAPNRVVSFLNPRTCGIYKSGGGRFKTDPDTGRRTDEVDNELLEAVEAYVGGQPSAGQAQMALGEAIDRRVLVPGYYDPRHVDGIRSFLCENELRPITIGELLEEGVLTVRGGHGSPGNDQRTGHIPYIKVSDIRALRVNINPTNLVTESVARRYWGGTSSGLQAWDIISPNRASSNIGEFAILLPGEEQVVITKEVFIFRSTEPEGVWSPFYLLWALSLRVVREQWRRIALMQTNREDCGNRYREVILPNPPDAQWATRMSRAFRAFFTTLANAKSNFLRAVASDPCEYIASLSGMVAASEDEQER